MKIMKLILIIQFIVVNILVHFESFKISKRKSRQYFLNSNEVEQLDIGGITDLSRPETSFGLIMPLIQPPLDLILPNNTIPIPKLPPGKPKPVNPQVPTSSPLSAPNIYIPISSFIPTANSNFGSVIPSSINDSPNAPNQSNGSPDNSPITSKYNFSNDSNFEFYV